jgi:two-component system, NarL family, sensor kinase
MHTALQRPASVRAEGGVPRPATLVAAASVVMCLVAVVLATRADVWSVSAMSEQPVDLAVGASFPLMGTLVLAGRRTSRLLGLVFVGAGAAAAVTAFVAAFAASAVSQSPAVLAAVQLNGFVWVLGFLPLLTLVPLLYPDGRLPGPRWRLAVATSVAGTALLALAAGLHDETFAGRLPVTKPVTSDALATPLGVVATVLLVPSVLAALASLVVRLRHSAGLRRRQVSVLLAASGVLLLEVAVHSSLPAAVQPFAQAAAVLLVPVGIGVAITRHRAFELDLAICRVLVAVSVAVCLGAAFLTSFAVLRAVLGGPTTLATGVAAGGTALLLQPLAARLSQGADRLLYGDRADPFAVISRFSARLRDGLPLEEIPLAICETVVGSLRLGSAALEVAGVDTVVGDPEGPTYAVDLVHRGRPVGRLTVTPRPGERALDPRDRELLAAIADQVAPAVSSLGAYAQLRRSREALVAAREEERRRVRRELHDGVGAALAGARLQLESARALVDDPVAGRLLDAAGAGVAVAVQDVRHVTEDLRPPAIDELGLTGALCGLADRVTAPGRAVDVDVDELPALPAAVEVACYRIAAEALSNAVRHSGGGRFRVSARIDGVALVLEVADDGHGLPVVPRRGLGLDSMRQRAEEIGGRLTLEAAQPPSAAHPGTVVRAELAVELA